MSKIFDHRMTEDDATRWEGKRTGGKWRFVLLKGLTFSVLIYSALVIVDWLWGEQVNFSLVKGLFFLLIGFFMGLVMWWNQEARYKTYILDRKIEKGLR